MIDYLGKKLYRKIAKIINVYYIDINIAVAVKPAEVACHVRIFPPSAKPTFTHLLTAILTKSPPRPGAGTSSTINSAGGCFTAILSCWNYPGCNLALFSYDRAMHIQGQAPPGTIAFAVDFGSRGRIKYCGQEATSPGNLFLTHPAHEALSFVGAESQKLAVLVFSGEEFNDSGYIFYHQEVRHLLRENQALRAMPSRLVRLKRLIKDIFEVTTASPEAILELAPGSGDDSSGIDRRAVWVSFAPRTGLIREKTSPRFSPGVGKTSPGLY